MARDRQPDRSTSRFDNLGVYLLVVLSLVIGGGGICGYLVWTKPSPSGEPEPDRGRLVRVFRAEKTFHHVAVSAYGSSRASEQWTAISEVGGEAVYLNPRFEEGEVLSAFEDPKATPPVRTLLVRIDPEQYELAVERHSAEVRAEDEQLKELAKTEANLRQIRELQASQLELARKEVARQEQLRRNNATTDRAVEAAKDVELARFTALQQTDNKLALIPLQMARARASRDAFSAQLKQAQRQLRQCEMRLPYAVRCLAKSVEEGQYVTPGERLGTFLALDTAEVVAMVETRKMPNLLPKEFKDRGLIDLAEWTQQESPFELLEIPVKVSRALGDAWGTGGEEVIWWGRVTRIASSLDSGTQTVPVIIEVRDPYRFQPGVRPPLLPDILCEITAFGTKLEDVVVIPRDALRDGRVYLLREAKPAEAAAAKEERRTRGAESRRGEVFTGTLHVQPVKVAALEEDLAVIGEGIGPGDLVILSDVPLAGVLTGIAAVGEGTRLRGTLVKNTVKPRPEVDYPKDLFQKPDEPAAERPAADAPGDRPSAASGPSEATP